MAWAQDRKQNRLPEGQYRRLESGPVVEEVGPSLASVHLDHSSKMNVLREEVEGSDAHDGKEAEASHVGKALLVTCSLVRAPCSANGRG